MSNVSRHHMHLRAVVVAAAQLSCAASAIAQHCATPTSVGAATSFYRLNYSFIHSGAESPPLTPSLRELVGKNIEENLAKGNVGPIDWDFWTDSQDSEPEPEVSAELIGEFRLEAVVRLRYGYKSSPTERRSDKVTDVHLIKSPAGCWLVDNLVHNKQDLRELLSQHPNAEATRR